MQIIKLISTCQHHIYIYPYFHKYELLNAKPVTYKLNHHHPRLQAHPTAPYLFTDFPNSLSTTRQIYIRMIYVAVLNKTESWLA